MSERDTRPPVNPPRPVSRAMLVALFLISGATSLVYETVWARQLHLVFGTSQLAICTVLAAFMAGLAVGALLAARWSRAIRNPLAAYAALEAGIGVYALVFPWLLEATEPLYLAIRSGLDAGPTTYAVAQFLIVGLLLLPPTVCMGATLPLLTRYARDGEEGLHVGRLYGANTLGAVAGTALGGFVLLPQLGLSTTTLAAALANGLLAAAAGLLAKRIDAHPAEPVASNPTAPEIQPRSHSTTLLLVAAVAGFASLLYEVAWFRLLVLILGGSAYAFSIMLLAFLLGIAIGGWVGGSSADRAFRRHGMGHVLFRLALLQMGVAMTAWLAMYAYGELPFAFVWLFDKLGKTPRLLWFGQLSLAMVIMLPPALLMGATFPYLVRGDGASADGLSRRVGRLYGANTIGAVLGAFSGGVYLLPALHIRGAVQTATSINLIAGLLAVTAAVAVEPQRRRRRLLRYGSLAAVLGTVIFLFAPPWNALLMTSGMYQNAKRLPERSRRSVQEFVRSRGHLVYYAEGRSSIVTVVRTPNLESLWLANNGKIDASTHEDAATQILLAHLPFAFRPEAKNVLAIGLASGITAGTITLYDAPTRIDICEIEPAMLEACHMFDEHNYHPLGDPRVRMIFNDARHHLLLVPDGTYDIVSSEPSNPWLTGVANLFTREFFELGKRKLAASGIWVQWVQCYGMSRDDLASLLGTFADTYSQVRLFRIDAADLIMIGSDAELDTTAKRLGSVMHSGMQMRANFLTADYTRPEQILALYCTDRNAILNLARGLERNTDDNMRIEYAAPLNVSRPTQIENTAMLRSVAQVPWSAIEDLAGLIELARVYVENDDIGRAKLVLREAIKREPDDRRVRALINTVRAGGR